MNPEERLRYYATQFNTVEVDAPYYALPTQRMVELHCERTPADFILNYKAFALMTEHKADPNFFPKHLKELLPAELFSRHAVSRDDLPPNILERIYQEFTEAMMPAVACGKLGIVLLQFPRWFIFGKRSLDRLRYLAERFSGLPLAVEFRHGSWTTPRHIGTVEAVLSDLEMTYVPVDEPQFESGVTVPPIRMVTSDISYVRFHGRNTGTWFKAAASASDRFNYLYTAGELREWVDPLKELAGKTGRLFVMFNNNYEDQGVVNARTLISLLGDK